MDKHAVALALEEIGALLRLQGGENRFRARAFGKAARAIEKIDADLGALVAAGAVDGVPGIGPATARIVRELVQTGRAGYLDDLRQRTPSGMRDLFAVPGLGTSKVEALHTALGISSLDDLEAAARAGRIAQVRGFGERMQARILEGIGFVRGTSGRRRYAPALVTAERLLGFLRAQPGIQRAELAGEVRRGLETVNGVDFVVAAERDVCDAVLDAFLALAPAAGGERSPERARARLADGLELRMRCVTPDRFATAWLFETGSDAHLHALQQRAHSMDIALDAEGLQRAGHGVVVDDEGAIYAALRMECIPPELRDDAVWVERAVAGTLPALIRHEDLRGCFHCHTVYSDGRATIGEMAEAAIERGWSYLGIADHSQNAGYAGGLSPTDVRRQHAEIDAWNRHNGDRLWLFKGIEADILADGTVDYSDQPGVLASFDFVIGSIHSHLRMSRADMTARVLRALDNPHLTMLGHATGRLLLARAESELDLDAVIERAAQRQVTIEINADPHRLDLDWRYWPKAKAHGVTAAINPDAHSTESLDYVHYGIVMARKAGLEATDVINTRPLNELKHTIRRAG